MSRQLTSDSTLDNLKREAKRWLKALRAHEPEARARLERACPDGPAEPTLRDVQHALAREHEMPGWTALRLAVARIAMQRTADAREHAIRHLLEASASGDAAPAGTILDSHPDIIDELAVIPGHTGTRTALHHAIAHEPVVRLLLERGANPNIRDEGDDAMPLHFAAERGDLAIVRLLIEHGADPIGDGTHHELNVLGWAVCWEYVHHTHVADYLIAHGAQHTIHTAVALGEVALIRELAARAPADLEKPMDRTNRCRRPLHLAVVKQRLDSLAALLEMGADTEAVDAAGLTPLDQAALNGAADMVRLLVEHGADVRLPAAIALNRMADIDRIVRRDPDCLRPGNEWGTLIVRASERAHADVIEALIRAGASVNVRDDPGTAVDGTEGYTPLHAAAWAGRTEAVAVLLKHGADPNARESKYCGTPAGWADYAGHADVRDLVLDARIDLFQAIDFGRADRIAGIVQQEPALLEKRFVEYATCEYPEPWHTPLAWAVVRNEPAAVRALLDQGAASILAPDGRTLLQIAQEAGHEEVAELLRASGSRRGGTSQS
jgi:ankyrin repeat protein